MHRNQLSVRSVTSVGQSLHINWDETVEFLKLFICEKIVGVEKNQIGNMDEVPMSFDNNLLIWKELLHKNHKHWLIEEIVFHHDNAKPHAFVITVQNLMEFSWDVLPYPPYNPDFTPSDFYLFRSLLNSLNGKKYKSLEDAKIHMEGFFQSKDKTFWRNWIMKLPERWAKVIENNGQYIS